MQIIRPRYGYLSLLITGVLFPAVLVIRRVWFGLDWFYENGPVLQSLQTISGFFALSAGVILFIIGVNGTDSNEEQSRRERRYIPWVTCALLSMGSLTALSSALPFVDSRYLAVELMSQLLGGIFCLMVWLPYRWSKISVVRWTLPIFAILSATTFGVFVMFSNTQFVSLLNGSHFGPGYVLLTQISGTFFFLAFVRFVIQFKKYGRSSDLVFAQLTLLSGASDLVFERFHLWGPIWWTWHSLQFISLFVTFLYMFALNYRQEKALQESEARFNQLSNVVFEGVLLTEKGSVFDTNKAFEELAGISQVQCVGRDIDSFFAEPIKRTFDGVSVEGRLKRNDGSLIDVEVRRRHGCSEGAEFFTVHDVSQRKQHEVELERLASELERSNCELENFAHLASHDLREPLRMVSSFLALLQRKHSSELDDEGKEFVRFAVDGAQRMELLVKGLLEYAKARHEPIRTEMVDCRQLLDDSLNDLQVAIKESGAEIKCGSLPEVSADAVQLRRVFENLMQNAIKFRGEKPLEINIRAIDRDSHWRFEFADNGRGIAMVYQQKIFDLFARGPDGQQDGTGMGLAACKAVIERHGGHMGVVSRENSGSVFYFSLPKGPAMQSSLNLSSI